MMQILGKGEKNKNKKKYKLIKSQLEARKNKFEKV